MNTEPTAGAGFPPFMVRTAGESVWPDGGMTIGSKQGDVTLIVILESGAVYRSPAGDLPLRQGRVGLIPDEDPGFLFASPGTRASYAWCRFNGEYAMRTARRITERHRARFFRTAQHAAVLDCIRAMGKHIDIGQSFAMGQREVLLARALVLLDEEHASPPRAGMDADVLKTYLRKHLYEPIDVAKAAHDLGMHRTSLARAARRLLGKSISELLEDLKIVEAEKLMIAQQHSIKEIAYGLGFSNPSYFGRVFKKHTGQSPRHWIERNVRPRQG